MRILYENIIRYIYFVDDAKEFEIDNDLQVLIENFFVLHSAYTLIKPSQFNADYILNKIRYIIQKPQMSEFEKEQIWYEWKRECKIYETL